jgi:GxxExxY protein
MTENELAKIAVDVAFQVHRALGPGLLESVYQTIMVYELRKSGLEIKAKEPIPIFWDSVRLEKGFEADIIVVDKLLLELKSVEQVHPLHKKQLLTYLRLTNLRLGLLINFGSELIRDGIFRVVNGLPE